MDQFSTGLNRKLEPIVKSMTTSASREYWITVTVRTRAREIVRMPPLDKHRRRNDKALISPMSS